MIPGTKVATAVFVAVVLAVLLMYFFGADPPVVPS
jgi:hypothetical protein